MRERITYLLHVGEQGFDPSTLTVSKDSLALPPIKAAKEHRLTIGFSELPQEVTIHTLSASFPGNAILTFRSSSPS